MRLFLGILLCFSSASLQALAQAHRLQSDIDQDLTFKTVAVLPLEDNVSGIYAKALDQHFRERLEADRQWTLVDVPFQAKAQSFEDNPEQVKKVYQSAKAQALVTGQIIKGPKGISIKLGLYAGKDGWPLLFESVDEYKGFEMADVKVQVGNAVQKLKSKIPYRGMILSRKGQLVTLNLGSRSGLLTNDEVTAIQVIKLHRHPKYHFITGSDSVIMGKITVQKVDDSLSFGTILSEREENSIQAGTKVVPVNFKQYSELAINSEGQILNGLDDRRDKKIAFGDNPEEWLPNRSPSFGRVGVLLGFGSYNLNNSLDIGAAASNNSFVPSIHLDGEMWLSANWYLEANLSQYVFRTPNSYPTPSSPSHLNVSTIQTTFEVGYNFLVNDDFFGPKMQLSLGYGKMSSFIDQGNPPPFNSLTYSAPLIGLGGSFPVKLTNRKQLSLGGKYLYYWKPRLDESPTSSGEVINNTVSSFQAFGHYRFTESMRFRVDVMFDLYSSSLSGFGTRVNTASSISHSMTTVAAGFEFMF